MPLSAKQILEERSYWSKHPNKLFWSREEIEEEFKKHKDCNPRNCGVTDISTGWFCLDILKISFFGADKQ